MSDLRFRICPEGAGWKVQEYRESFLGYYWLDCTEYCVEFDHIRAAPIFFRSEDEAKDYIVGRHKHQDKVDANLAIGCYEWKPGDDHE